MNWNNLLSVGHRCVQQCGEKAWILGLVFHSPQGLDKHRTFCFRLPTDYPLPGLLAFAPGSSTDPHVFKHFVMVPAGASPFVHTFHMHPLLIPFFRSLF